MRLTSETLDKSNINIIILLTAELDKVSANSVFEENGEERAFEESNYIRENSLDYRNYILPLSSEIIK